MKNRRKRWKKILLIIACVIAAVFLINQITVYPFIWTFRGIMGLTGQQGNPGDYSDAIASVPETTRVNELLDEMSSVKHVTAQYPAVFITVGDADPLEPQTKEFVEALARNHVDHTALFWTDTGAGLDHDYIYMMNTPQAQKAYEMAVVFLARNSENLKE